MKKLILIGSLLIAVSCSSKGDMGYVKSPCACMDKQEIQMDINKSFKG
ncbi:MAG: hypothetical protein HOM96_02375 [Rickettsiales bacterium]|jgi:hypothetical protein|nr:hypothetical protein [Rickettsiales bacterium]